LCGSEPHPIRAFDIAARPPDSTYFQKDGDTLEKRSSRRLRELSRQSQNTGFDLNAWNSRWVGGDSDRSIPEWNWYRHLAMGGISRFDACNI
jgi:hypothetical protein